jgi:hypothetical protein
MEEKGMLNESEKEAAGLDGRLGGCILWFIWGVSLSFMTILSLVLLILLAASVTLNVYLGWELSGLEVAISRPGTGSPQAPLLLPTSMLAAIPTNTPPPPTSTATSLAPTSPLEEQVATLSALATNVTVARADQTPAAESVSPAVPIAPPGSAPPAVAISSTPQPADTFAPTPQSAEPAEPEATAVSPTTPAAVAAASQQKEAAQEFVPPATSSNTYELIPIEGDRESRPAAEHGDLNLKLREPEPIDVDLSLVDIPGSGIDPNAPSLSSVFEPDFVQAYTIHDWDWGCNCKGSLLKEDNLVLVGIKTTPGAPVFIPRTERDIFGGNYHAVVLYASEDSLTFLYSRAGTVVKGYTVHYLGLHTDPNLVALFQESKGSELPGLTLDTPVGVASDQLIVAIRDNGKFLDARSRQDWWK